MDIMTFIGMVLLLTWPVCILLLPIVVVIILIFKGKKMRNDIYPGYQAIMQQKDTEKEEDEKVEYKPREPVAYEELPFQQLFKISPDMSLIIDHVEMCPDETAFIRVLGEKSYTPLYKRKVRRDKNNSRFIVFNERRYYLKDKKTQPTISKK